MQPIQTIGTLLAWLCAAAVAGAWTTACLLLPGRATGPWTAHRVRLVRVAQAAGAASLAGIAAQVVATSHDGSPRAVSTGWLVAGAATLGALLASLRPRPTSGLYALLLTGVALVAPVVAREAVAPRDHDLTGDAQVVAAACGTVLAGLALLSPLAGSDTVTTRRRRVLATALAVPVVVADLVVVLLRGLDGPGAGHLVRALCAVGIALLAGRAARPLHWAAVLLGLVTQAAATTTLLADPRGAGEQVPADVQAFGYSVAAWPTLANLVVHGRVNLFFLVLALAAVTTYLLLVARLRRHGGHWPPGRTAAWLIGWTIVVLLTSSGVGRYAPAVFSVHMFMNLGLNMLCAMVLVLGGFLTLVQRAFPARDQDTSDGPHEWLDALLHSRLVGLLYNPVIALVFMVGTYYVFYLTSLYATSLHVHWLHQYFYLHFLVSGYVFYGLIIGVDEPPHPLPHIGKLGLIIGAMPFHAFFGVILMSKEAVFGEAFLNSLGHGWMAARGLMHDQWVGGTIAWAGGEFPLVIALVALLTQWKRQDSSEGQALDRGIDTGTDESYDAYNDMLAQLARRDRTGRG